MANDITAAAIWTQADVYVADSLTTTNPADASAVWGSGWNQLGILDGGEGFKTDAQFADIKKHYGWGTGVVRKTRKNWEETKKFTCLEDNQYTRALLYPGSAAGEISIPTIVNLKMGFELREGGKVKRYITKNYAQVDIDGSIDEGEEDLTKYPFIAEVFPDANGQRWVLLDHPAVTSIAITPSTLALAVAGVKALVATATYDDNSTGVVTSQATWSSSAPTRATVAFGYVTGVATGATVNVSCVFGGVTATAPSVVTVS